MKRICLGKRGDAADRCPICGEVVTPAETSRHFAEEAAELEEQFTKLKSELSAVDLKSEMSKEKEQSVESRYEVFARIKSNRENRLKAKLVYWKTFHEPCSSYATLKNDDDTAGDTDGKSSVETEAAECAQPKTSSPVSTGTHSEGEHESCEAQQPSGASFVCKRCQLPRSDAKVSTACHHIMCSACWDEALKATMCSLCSTLQSAGDLIEVRDV